MALVTVIVNGNDGKSGHSKVLTRLFSTAAEYPARPRDGSVVSRPAKHLPPTTGIEGRLLRTGGVDRVPCLLGQLCAAGSAAAGPLGLFSAAR